MSKEEQFAYLNSVISQISSHAACAVLDGQRLVAPYEAAGQLWVEFLVVLCRGMDDVILVKQLQSWSN